MKSKLLICSLAFSLAASAFAADVPAGIKPVGPDGQPLNLDFENGTLKDWTATGDAFVKQPVKGDAVAARRPDMKSKHAGTYWFGSFEGGTDDATGAITSVSFKVTQPWGSFLVGGGGSDKTRVEIVAKESARETVISQASGQDKEDMA